MERSASASQLFLVRVSHDGSDWVVQVVEHTNGERRRFNSLSEAATYIEQSVLKRAPNTTGTEVRNL